MRSAWIALGACAALAACAPAGYNEGYGYSAPGYAYAAPSYGYPYPYTTGPAVIGVWGGSRHFDRNRFEHARLEHQRFRAEHAFRAGVNPAAPHVWPGFDRRAAQAAQHRPPPAREAFRAATPPHAW